MNLRQKKYWLERAAFSVNTIGYYYNMLYYFLKDYTILHYVSYTRTLLIFSTYESWLSAASFIPLFDTLVIVKVIQGGNLIIIFFAHVVIQGLYSRTVKH